MKQKKLPLRMCIGCGEHKDKKELLRIVRDSDGNIFIDKTGKSNGRGAYLCNNVECLNRSIKKGALNRSLGVETDEKIINELKEHYGPA